MRLGGETLGTQLGYYSSFEAPVHVTPGALLEVEVNSTRALGRDGLVGEMDLEADGVLLQGWGGIGGHVYLERRGAAYLVDPYVRPAS